MKTQTKFIWLVDAIVMSMLVFNALSYAQLAATIGPGLSASAKGSCISSGSLIVNSGGTLNLDSGTVCLSANGSPLTINGTCNSTHGVFQYRGTGAQTITTNPGNGGLTIDNTAGVTLGAPIIVGDTLTLANGVFNIGGNLTLANGATIARRNGSLSAVPTFGTAVNVAYTGTSPITTGPELPTNTLASNPSEDISQEKRTASTSDVVESPTASSTLQDLAIDNSGGVTLNADATVNDSLKFLNGKLTLGTRNLTIAGAGKITGASATKYVVTDNTGTLTRKAIGASSVSFPVGNSASYTPVTMANSGTVDDFSVRVKATPPFDSPPRLPNNVVNRQWTITESVPGGSNVLLVLQWNVGDQGSGFTTATNVVIGRYDGARWNEAGAILSGGGPYSATGGAFTSFSPFGVGNTGAFRTVALANLKFMLEGPFNTGTNLMDNTLRASVLPAQFPGKPIPALAVDSVQIEIRGTPTGLAPLAPPPTGAQVETGVSDKTRGNSQRMANQESPGADISDNAQTGSASLLVANPKISQPAWLLADGTIRNFTDTTKNYVEFDTTAGNWYVVVRHRNHLAIMMRLARALSSTTPVSAYDFTTSQNQAYGTNPMKLVGTKYCLYAGDANQSGIVTAADANTVFGQLNTTGYNQNDINLSGIVTAADANMIFGDLNASQQFSAPIRSNVTNAEKKETEPSSARPAEEN